MMRRSPQATLDTVATNNPIRSAGITPAPSVHPNFYGDKSHD